METRTAHDGLIPPDLLEQVEALAASEHRPARDILREALETYLHDHGTLAAPSQDDDCLEKLLLDGLASNRLPLDAAFRAQLAEKTTAILNKHKDRARP